MNCKHVTDVLSPLMDGELSPEMRAQTQAHLDTCPSCAREYAHLQRAALLLENDARAPQMPLPDLYPMFQQRLVTQPARTSFLGRRMHPNARTWLLPRLAVGVAGIAIVGRMAWLKVFPHTGTEQLLLGTINSLEQPNEAASVVNSIWHSSDAKRRERLTFSYSWWQKGYAYTEISRQTPLQNAQPDAKSREFAQTFACSTPGGVSFSWGRVNDNSKVVRMDWTPCDPAHPENNNAKALADDASRILHTVLEGGKSSQIEITRAVEQVGRETMHRVSFSKLKRALIHSEGNSADMYFPEALTLWFDADSKLRRVSEEHQTGNGSHWEDKSVITYQPPALSSPANWIASPNPPRNRLFVLGYDLPSKIASIPVERLVQPVWLTMTKQEKDAVEQTVWDFSQAWRYHDAARLRALVDVDQLLAITRPDKRAGLTREDVWQKAWLDHLQRQPRWRFFNISTDFAFEAAPRLLDEFPLNAGEWQVKRTLPGLNVLAWINAEQADRQEYKVAARLYLVKRPSGWKVYQFGQLFNGAAKIP